MKYDIRMHCPQQVEMLLQAEHQGNIEVFERCLTNLKEILSDNGFIHDLRDYETQKDNELEKAKNIWIKAITAAGQQTTFDTIAQQIQTADAELEQEIQTIMNNYVNTVKTYVLSYMPQVVVADL